MSLNQKKLLELLSSLPPVLTTKQAAVYLGFSMRFLEVKRRNETGPDCIYSRPATKTGRVRYRKDTLDRYMPGGAAENLSPKEAAQELERSESWLEKMRGRDDGPRFVRYGQKLIRYPRADLMRWKAEHTPQSLPR